MHGIVCSRVGEEYRAESPVLCRGKDEDVGVNVGMDPRIEEDMDEILRVAENDDGRLLA